MSWRSRAVPSPLIVTSTFVVVPVASMVPLPGSATVRLGLMISVGVGDDRLPRADLDDDVVLAG